MLQSEMMHPNFIDALKYKHQQKVRRIVKNIYIEKENILHIHCNCIAHVNKARTPSWLHLCYIYVLNITSVNSAASFFFLKSSIYSIQHLI